MTSRNQDVVKKYVRKSDSTRRKDPSSTKQSSSITKQSSSSTKDNLDKNDEVVLQKSIKRNPNTSVTSKINSLRNRDAVASDKSSLKSKISSRTVVASKSSLDDSKCDTTNKKLTTKPTRPAVVSKSGPSTSMSSPNIRNKITTVPDSKRVVKSQYYPNLKEMYKTALKSDRSRAETELSSMQKSKSKSRSEVVLKSKKKEEPNYSSDTSTSLISDRPRTATLAKGVFVNSENLVGPEPEPIITKVETELLEKTSPELKIDEYEDDFDSYASDFEEYNSSSNPTTKSSSTSEEELNIETIGAITSSSSSSSEDETTIPKKANSYSDEDRKLDSGNFDMPENKHKHILDNIIESVENNHNQASLSDEGFEEGKVVSSQHFINFTAAKLKLARQTSAKSKRKRGEEILSMIRLDLQTYTLFDTPAVSYDDFIKSFGNQRASQVACQTSDDAVCEETQTDVVENTNKWTQFPVAFSKIDETDDDDDQNCLRKLQKQLLGVGSDSAVNSSWKLDYSEAKLRDFLGLVEPVVSSLLNQSNLRFSKDIEVNTEEIAFSEGYIMLNTNFKEFLSSRSIELLQFSVSSSNKMLSVHKKINKKYRQGQGEVLEELDLKSLICVWDIKNVNEPEAILSTFGDINSCCFHIGNSSLIFAGLTDGTISFWNLPSQQNTTILDGCIISSPTFTTDIHSNITTPVVFVVTSFQSIDQIVQSSSKNVSTQLYTLNADSILRIWGIIPERNNSYTIVENHKLLLSSFYPEQNDMHCLGAIMNQLDSNHIFISTNYGYIIHCLTTRTKPIPKTYGKVSDLSLVNCLTVCPYEPFHFLAGSNDGTIGIYSRSLARPLISFNSSSAENAEIKCIQWSQNKPCMFYVLDSKNMIHVWNLGISDLVPVESVLFKESINNIVVSPSNPISSDRMSRTYLAVSTDKDIYLHLLNKEHGQQTHELYHNDIKKFLNYVNRL